MEILYFRQFPITWQFLSTLLGESVAFASLLWWRFWRTTQMLMRHNFDHGLRHNLRTAMRDEIILSPQRRYPFASIPTPKVRGLSGDICCNRVLFLLKINWKVRFYGILRSLTTWLLKMGSINCPETSERNSVLLWVKSQKTPVPIYIAATKIDIRIWHVEVLFCA